MSVWVPACILLRQLETGVNGEIEASSPIHLLERERVGDAEERARYLGRGENGFDQARNSNQHAAHRSRQRTGVALIAGECEPSRVDCETLNVCGTGDRVFGGWCRWWCRRWGSGDGDEAGRCCSSCRGEGCVCAAALLADNSRLMHSVLTSGEFAHIGAIHIISHYYVIRWIKGKRKRPCSHHVSCLCWPRGQCSLLATPLSSPMPTVIRGEFCVGVASLFSSANASPSLPISLRSSFVSIMLLLFTHARPFVSIVVPRSLISPPALPNQHLYHPTRDIPVLSPFPKVTSIPHRRLDQHERLWLWVNAPSPLFLSHRC